MRFASVETIAGVLGALPPGPRVVVSGNFATPWRLVRALDEALAEYRLFALNAQPGTPDRPGVVLESPFVGPGMRSSPRLRYYPSRLALVPRLFSTTLVPDVLLLHTSVPRGGTISLGTEVNVLPAALEAVRRRGGLVVAQVNPQMPFTLGDAVVPTDDVDLAVEVDEPLATPPAHPVDDVSLVIGQRVAARVPEGATLQAGIGAVPDAVIGSLRGRRGLRVWTEMFSDGVLALERSGALDPGTPITSSFAIGTAELYAWLDGNTRVRMLRTEKTNDPALIKTNPLMVSVNTALQVDLYGQVNASRVGRRIYSGTGGQADFVVGALHSLGGQSLIALRSWHPKADRSTIVPMVEEPVTSAQMTAVVTEQGVAELFGHHEHEQARQLVEQAAHPSVREELREEALALGLA